MSCDYRTEEKYVLVIDTSMTKEYKKSNCSGSGDMGIWDTTAKFAFRTKVDV